jgi:hypothetical protein
MNTDTTRITILKVAFIELVMGTHWLGDHDTVLNAAEHLFKAEALIEILEVQDCGSTGGFDKTNPLRRDSRFKLMARFLTVLHKYNTVAVVNNKDYTVAMLNARFDRMVNVH